MLNLPVATASLSNVDWKPGRDKFFRSSPSLSTVTPRRTTTLRMGQDYSHHYCAHTVMIHLQKFVYICSLGVLYIHI